MPTTTDWTERNQMLAALLAKVALGDRAAFAALYRACSAHLFGVILRINADRAQAEDLLQDLFVNLWRTAHSYDANKAQALTWLTSVARNRAIDSLRRRKTEVRSVSSTSPHHPDSGEGDNEADDLLSKLPSDEPGPLSQLLQAAERQELSRCVGALSAQQQQCVALAFYQGLSYAEVAEHLSRPLGSVKSWVRRALGSLKDCLDHLPSGVPEATPGGKG